MIKKSKKVKKKIKSLSGEIINTKSYKRITKEIIPFVPKEKYTIEMAQKICRAVAVSSDSLIKICKDNPEFPNKNTIYAWRLDIPEFAEMYMNAKRVQADILVDELLTIADDSSQDVITRIDANGQEYQVANTEFISRSKARIETRKWLATKLLPRLYGDKISNETTVTFKHEDALKELE